MSFNDDDITDDNPKGYTPSHEDWKRLNWMDRGDLEKFLENLGYQTYDRETDIDLKNTIISLIGEGEITPDDLPEA
jgi:hypothetical protein